MHTISSRGFLMSDYKVKLSVDARNDIVSIRDYIGLSSD